ncbi:MAG: DUF2284 domain-containing protein [Oscillospiraceae bacterium]|nr:DUF2284 domain-containing protein [Oscillospiraceae bacterium]
MDLCERVRALAAETGFSESGFVEIARLRYLEDVRRICEGNSCRGYGATWACPPAVGTLAQCRARVESFERMLLFSRKYELEDSFDFEGMRRAMRDFKALVDDYHRRLQPVLRDFQLLSNEGCGRCEVCTCPDAPCRFPELLHHSLEGYGFLVQELAQAAGIRYNGGKNTVTFFGALLFGRKDA